MGIRTLLSAAAVVTALALSACDDEGSGDVHDEGDVRAVLNDLPYEYKLRSVELDGAQQAYAGEMTEPHGVKLPFAISFCEHGQIEEALRDCPTARLRDAFGVHTELRYGDVYLTLAAGNRLMESRQMSKRRVTMAVELDDALCHAATDGEDCSNG